MICAITARRVDPELAEEFMDAFMGDPANWPPLLSDKFRGVYACRNTDDPGMILTFGLFDGTREELMELQAGQGRSDQMDRIEELVEETIFTGTFDMMRDYFAEADGAMRGDIAMAHS
jgi:hypothetical protein